MKRRAMLWAIAAVLVTAATATASPLIEHIVGEISQSSYTDYQQTIEDMGLGLYGGAGYDQGYRGRNAISTGDSLGNQECRLYLQDQFTAMGLSTTVQGTYHNVVAELAGTVTPDEIYIIGAHYDSTTGNPRPGGDDNASGTAGILELARILSQYEFESTIRLIGFNAEEDGLWGSEDYVDNVVIPGGENVVGMISLDMILRPYNNANPSAPIDLDLGCPNSADDLAWVAEFISASNTYVPELAIDPTTPFIQVNGRSDHDPFYKNGYAAFLAIENSVGEISPANPYYHSAEDWSGGAAGAQYDYAFAADVTQAVAATLAVEAGIVPEEILVLADPDVAFTYQNAPQATADRNLVVLTLAVGDDLNGNTSYTTLVTQVGGPGEVTLSETGNPMVWLVVGSRHGVGAVGEVALQAQIGGNEYGGEGSTLVTVDVRLLGDVNGDGVVDTHDKSCLNNHLNGLSDAFGHRAYDLDSDGVTDTGDKSLMNNVLNGLPIH